MPLPPDIDEKIRDRFKELIKEGESLVPQMKVADEAMRMDYMLGLGEPAYVLHQSFAEWCTKVKSLLTLLSGNSGIKRELDNIIKATPELKEAEKILGVLKGLYSDYQNNMLSKLTEFVEAEVMSDYMGQALQLLNEGPSGKYDHVPAAVLTGAVLEDALRRLCQRQSPPISVFDSKGNPKKMSVMIEDLKKSGLYNELKAKQLRSWAGTRNHAAHGEFTEFNRADVEAMITGVENFLRDYL